MKKRLAILVGVPTPYREPVFERLAGSSEYEIRVLYCRRRQADQQWQMLEKPYQACFLKNYAPAAWVDRLLISEINPSVWRELRVFQPEAVIVYGYHTVSTLLAILWAIRGRVPFLLRGDSNPLDEAEKPLLTLWMKRLFLRWLTKRAVGFLSIGTLNSAYWLEYGASSEKVFMARYAVDNGYFQTQAAAYRGARQRISEENGWKQPYLLLYVGRLIPHKRVDVVIEAMRRLSAKRSDIALLIVGDGVERKALEKRAQALPQVFFLGFRDYGVLPKYYGVADLFVLPSETEPWGLVVNEAMASGLPVIATRKVGAAHDLIIEGENGYLVRENDVEAMASAIDHACQSKERLRALGERAQQSVASWNYDATLEGFHRALDYCFQAK